MARTSQKESCSRVRARKIKVESQGEGYNLQMFLGSQGSKEAKQRPFMPHMALGGSLSSHLVTLVPIGTSGRFLLITLTEHLLRS